MKNMCFMIYGITGSPNTGSMLQLIGLSVGVSLFLGELFKLFIN